MKTDIEKINHQSIIREKTEHAPESAPERRKIRFQPSKRNKRPVSNGKILIAQRARRLFQQPARADSSHSQSYPHAAK